jgi:ribonucleotide monophosphatase NagD (HAD superfamily)
MIGAGILTDLPAARAVGARCVLMLTGVSSRLEAEALAGDEAPDAIAADAVELEAALSILRTGGRP